MWEKSDNNHKVKYISNQQWNSFHKAQAEQAWWAPEEEEKDTHWAYEGKGAWESWTEPQDHAYSAELKLSLQWALSSS